MDQPYRSGDDVFVLPTHVPIPGAGHLPINAYVLMAEEPVLIDTGLASDGPEFLAALESVISPADLRWIWLTHDDADHTGSLQRVMELAPNATLATNGMNALRMSTWWPVPFERVHAVTFDDRLHVGDRNLRALRPPVFDNPATIGIHDELTGTLFSVDSFGAVLPEMTEDAAEIPSDVLTQGMLMWGAVDAPWAHLVDVGRFDAVLDAVRQLDPSRVLSSHLPAASGSVESFLQVLRMLRDAEPFIPPNDEAFQQMLALVAPATA
jgi:hypothetical protein